MRHLRISRIATSLTALCTLFLLPAAAMADPTLDGRMFEAVFVGADTPTVPFCIEFGDGVFNIVESSEGTWKRTKSNSKRMAFKMKVKAGNGPISMTLRMRGQLDTAGPGGAIAATGTLEKNTLTASTISTIAMAGRQVEECADEGPEVIRRVEVEDAGELIYVIE